ncbi:MAG TPA: TonB-dependent receptor, partial [Terriglobales bacterium]|nr:TonB-dependent receptor [Terriglobales bacterium]
MNVGGERTALLIKVACAAAIGALGFGPAYAQRVNANSLLLAFNIQAQPLEQALTEFGGQSGLQVMFQTDAVANRNAPAVVGELSAEEALKKLLHDSDLQYQFINRKTVAIKADEAVEPRHTFAEHVARTIMAQVQASGVPSSESADVETSDPRRDTPLHSRLQQVVITGTHISGSAPESSPITIYDRAYIERSGATTTSEFVRTIPQNFAAVDASTPTGTPGIPAANANSFRASGVNLRGLGTGSTLVLVDGHRIAPAGVEGAFTDVSLIPLSAVERIEVLTEGASAVYGSDAVAGVVNFVLRKSFNGAETSLTYGEATQGGRAERTISQALGTSWKSGNVIVEYENSDSNPLRANERDFVPGTAGKQFILPDQRAQSAFVSATQELSPATTIFASGLFGFRHFADTSTGGVTTEARGKAKQTGAVLGGSHLIGAGWRADIAADYSRLDQELQTKLFFSPTAQPISTARQSRSALISLDFSVSGSLIDLPGGSLKTSLGLSGRREEFDDFSIGGIGTGLARDVRSAYVEVLAPLIAEGNKRRYARRFEFSLAGRHDHYDRGGSSTDPKIGVLWSPSAGLNVRASRARSYRAAPLSQLVDTNRVYNLFPLPDPTASTGVSNALLLFSPGNPGLTPERSTSTTFGFDVEPPGLPALKVATTYFDIAYRNRINTPPATGGIGLIFVQGAALDPFIDRSPSLSELERIFSEETLINPLGLSPADVDALYDGRLHNLSKSRTSGFDVSAAYSLRTSLGEVAFFLGGTYLLKLESQAAPSVPSVDVVDVVYQPPALRL